MLSRHQAGVISCCLNPVLGPAISAHCCHLLRRREGKAKLVEQAHTVITSLKLEKITKITKSNPNPAPLTTSLSATLILNAAQVSITCQGNTAGKWLKYKTAKKAEGPLCSIKAGERGRTASDHPMPSHTPWPQIWAPPAMGSCTTAGSVLPCWDCAPTHHGLQGLPAAQRSC